MDGRDLREENYRQTRFSQVARRYDGRDAGYAAGGRVFENTPSRTAYGVVSPLTPHSQDTETLYDYDAARSSRTTLTTSSSSTSSYAESLPQTNNNQNAHQDNVSLTTYSETLRQQNPPPPALAPHPHHHTGLPITPEALSANSHRHSNAFTNARYRGALSDTLRSTGRRDFQVPPNTSMDRQLGERLDGMLPVQRHWVEGTRNFPARTIIREQQQQRQRQRQSWAGHRSGGSNFYWNDV